MRLATDAAIATACPICQVMVTDGVNDRQEEAGAAASRCSTEAAHEKRTKTRCA